MTRSISVAVCVSWTVLALAGCSDDVSAPADQGTGDIAARDIAAGDSVTGDGVAVDIAASDSAGRDSAQSDAPPADVRWKDIGGAFPCGASKICGSGQYCKSQLPGRCGGNPVPDSGTCPPDCKVTTCPNSTVVCLCTSYQCKSLPAGCSDCVCLQQQSPKGCTCRSQYGGLYLNCPGA